MYGTFIAIVIILQGIGTAVQQPHQQIPLQVIRWGWGGRGFQWSKISVVCRVMKGGVVVLEGLDGPLFQNGLERGQAHHWGSREGLHDPPIGGWVRQGVGWSRQKLVCSMVTSCRSESKLICRKNKQNREYIKIGNTLIVMMMGKQQYIHFYKLRMNA